MLNITKATLLLSSWRANSTSSNSLDDLQPLLPAYTNSPPYNNLISIHHDDGESLCEDDDSGRMAEQAFISVTSASRDTVHLRAENWNPNAYKTGAWIELLRCDGTKMELIAQVTKIAKYGKHWIQFEIWLPSTEDRKYILSVPAFTCTLSTFEQLRRCIVTLWHRRNEPTPMPFKRVETKQTMQLRAWNKGTSTINKKGNSGSCDRAEQMMKTA